MRIPVTLRGPLVVARHEFLVNLKSVRLIIMLVALALVVVGGAYGLSALGRGGFPLSPLVGWGHPAVSTNGEHVAVVWISDPFGTPLADRNVRFFAFSEGPGREEVELGQVRSDEDGFVRFPVGNRTSVGYEVRSGTIGFGSSLNWIPGLFGNFSVAWQTEDLDNDGFQDDLGVHVLTREGTVTAARILLNDTEVTTVNSQGYARVELPPGSSNLTVEVSGETYTTTVFVPPPTQSPFFSGPDFVLFIIAGGFATFVLPIFAIVVAFDAISKERVQGTLDLLLSRPVSRAGSVLGKVAGTFLAVAVPVTLVNATGIGVIWGVSGRPPTGTFAAAFMGLSLLLVAFYVLLQVVFSTLAKTSGTAILFGVLVYLAFNILYYVITAVLSNVLFPRNIEDQFRFLQLTVLGNPSQIYQQLVAFAAPGGLGSGFGQFGGTSLDLTAIAAAATIWIVLLLVLAVWTFHRKAAE